MWLQSYSIPNLACIVARFHLYGEQCLSYKCFEKDEISIILPSSTCIGDNSGRFWRILAYQRHFRDVQQSEFAGRNLSRLDVIFVKQSSSGVNVPDTWFRLPFWGLAYAPIVETNFPNLPCLFSTFHLEYTSVLSRFCLKSVRSGPVFSNYCFSKTIDYIVFGKQLFYEYQNEEQHHLGWSMTASAMPVTQLHSSFVAFFDST